MRDPGPAVLVVALSVLGGALVYDLARPRRVVSRAEFDWGQPRVAKLPELQWLDASPARPHAWRGAHLVLGDLRVDAIPRPPLEGPPPLGSEPIPPLPLPARAADPERLGAARAILGENARAAQIGPYRLLTDVPDGELVERLARMLEGLEAVYVARYGVAPIGTPLETIVLFAADADYAALVRSEERLTGLLPAGYAARGLVALPVGNRPWADVAAVLAHEVVHLLNRRALGPALPPWLDEGLAGDLGAARFDGRGAIVPDTYGGSVRVDWSAAGTAVAYAGGRAALLAARDRDLAGSGWSLAELTALPWEEFVRRDAQDLTYATSLLCVRDVLADAGTAGVFRDFLKSVAAGGPAESTALQTRLGWTWEE